MRVRIRALAVGLIFVLWLVNLIGFASYPFCAAAAPNDTRQAPDHFTKLQKPSKTSLRALDSARVRNLRGMIVENRDGQRLGKLEDFIVDIRSGHVNFALVSSGHGFAFRKHLKILPPQVLFTGTAKKGVLQLDIAYSRWQHAPRFKMTDLSTLNNSEPKAQIYAYYGQSVNTPKAAGDLLEYATTIIGKQVANRQHEFLGRFSDLLIDVTGQRPVLAIIIPDRYFTESGSFAVPVSLLRPSGDALTLDISRKMFTEAPILDEQSWQKESPRGAAVIYRFPEDALDAAKGSTSEAKQTTQTL